MSWHWLSKLRSTPQERAGAAVQQKVVALVASDEESLAREAREVLVHAGLECATQGVVSLDVVADRASRTAALLVVVVLPPDVERGMVAVGELARTVRTHLLVLGPVHDARLILQSLHIGVAEYLDVAQLASELTEAIVRFKARRAPQPTAPPSCRVISVLGPSGGSGTSTVAVNVATVLAQEHGTCCLVDLRLTAGDLASLLDLRPAFTLGDLCDRLERVDHGMFEQVLTPHSSGVHLVAAPRSIEQIGRVSTKGVRQALALARARFPYVVFDLDNPYGGEQAEALWQSDVVLLVTRLDYTSVRNVRRTLDHLRASGLGGDRIQVVVNRFGEAKQLRLAQAEEALGMKIAHAIPHDPARIHEAINAGVPVVLHKSSARVSTSLSHLAHSLNGRHTRS